MSKMRAINDSFWVDSWISDLDRHEKYFFLYLMTNSHMSIAGVYQLPIKTIAFESEFSTEEVIHMFKKMESKISYVDGWVILRNYIKHQNYKNSKIKIGIDSILKGLKVHFFEYIELPNDYQYDVPDTTKQTSLLMSHDESPMTLEVLTSTSTSTSTLESSASDAPKNFQKKEFTPQQKRAYAIAMKKERESKAAADKARGRPSSKPESASKTIERKWR